MTASYIYKKTQSIWSHPGFQKYFKNTGWMFMGRMFNLAVAFFLGIYIARYLGPSNYGLMNYTFSFVGLFGFLASMGVENIIKRELVNNPENKDSIIGTGLTLKITGAVVAILSIILTIPFFNPEPLVFALIVLFSLTYIFYAFDILNIYFESQTQSKYSVSVTITASIISAILKIIVISMGFGVVWLIATYVFESAFIATGLIIIFRKKGHNLKKMHFKLPIAKQILKDSWPLMLSGFAVNIYMRIDQVMINSILGNTGVGIYAAAVKLSEVWYLIPTVIGSSVSPAIIKSLKINEESFENRLFRLYAFMFYLSVAIAILVTIIAPWLVQFLFGEAYSYASIILQIYIWAGLGVFFGISFGYYLLAKNLTKISFYITFSGMIANVILNLLLIPKFGIAGAAVATLISYIISTSIIVIFKEPREHVIKMIKKPLGKISHISLW